MVLLKIQVFMDLTLLLNEQLMTFGRIIVSLSSGSSS
jgi:hypothetical protein